jgi:hypothetical protein
MNILILILAIGIICINLSCIEIYNINAHNDKIMRNTQEILKDYWVPFKNK